MFDPSMISAGKLAAKAHVAGSEQLAGKTAWAAKGAKAATFNGHELASKAQAVAGKAVTVNAHHGVI
jgi:hypothetical protein